jgi:hypothetical protein
MEVLSVTKLGKIKKKNSTTTSAISHEGFSGDLNGCSL